MNDLTEQILEEILKECEDMLWALARSTHIPGFEAEDLMQEMRIKIWRTIEHNHYDPERVQPTAFYYRVCKRHLINLNRNKIYQYNSTPAEERCYRDNLDQKGNSSLEKMHENSLMSSNFVENFSKDFIKCVLPSEEAKQVIEELYETGHNQAEDRTRDKKHQE